MLPPPNQSTAIPEFICVRRRGWSRIKKREVIHMKSSTAFVGIALAIGAAIASTGALADGMPAHGKMSAAYLSPCLRSLKFSAIAWSTGDNQELAP